MMKNFVLALALYASSGDFAGMLVAPGVYTQRECNTVKAMMDRDHWGLIGTAGDPPHKLFVKSTCVDTSRLPRPTTGAPDEMVK